VGKDPAQIRAEIEETRERMGRTIEAIGHKANVPRRMRASVKSTKETLASRVGRVVRRGHRDLDS
jgi:DNA-binding XRE family transcriptional regulator